MITTRYASILKRFIALIADLVIIKLILMALEFPLGLISRPAEFLSRHFHRFGLPDFDFWFREHLSNWIPGACGELPGWLTLLIFVLYFSVFECSWRQATPGKMLMGIFVTDLLGRRISFQRALGRSLGKILSTVICLIGYLMALFSIRSQALHDRLADSLVLEPEYSTSPPAAAPPSGGPAA
ncbi:MAG: hypothetical protein A3F83_03495 [Candidatus Glassbacteria bacterium RIFCSPLOWO2_12_FULL_58_11]|uniref:RDD domain-containing protein n=1 Tax=Candidatus Glassbacteria bacterium RIFCSPLOWO2_12_FULL_58_11 TaxID=1817867 RepID=A0A1F5YXR2_9BACT|nr:MAG: hypothetical protein A3F83_03495 [Candidatus Glassbacteria bacterium RIFCSPLOWO2_12_FULL_58_11]